MHRSLTRCASCRASVLDAFASLAGISSPIAARRQPTVRLQVNRARQFSAFRALKQSPSPSTPEDSEALPTISQSEPIESNTSIPWYLQVEEPAPPSTPILPLLSRQEIPPLPENPPPILSPILEFLSTQIGLDDLVLLDLRHLDPPPALGSNLLMIIGTARSVKHLNVSADRLCRWVRKEYKLRPFADGLLGRNELKLKLRRKARRLKMAQSVGNTTMEQSSVDDGITTGWICVNMGLVDVDIPASQANAIGGQAQSQPEEEVADEEEYENPKEEDTYVGFGSQSTAPRIVVQMFTDEKRADMDLEGLWAGRSTRRARQAQKADAIFGYSVLEEDAAHEARSLGENHPADGVGQRDMEMSWNESKTFVSDEDVTAPDHLDESNSRQ